MKVTLVDGPAAGREYDIADNLYLLNVPCMDPEVREKLTAVMWDGEEGDAPVDTSDLLFKVAVYGRNSRYDPNMYCIDPVPKVERCPTCNRIL